MRELAVTACGSEDDYSIYQPAKLIATRKKKKRET
jgi:hypothetical protein